MTGGEYMTGLVSVFLPTFSRLYDGYLEKAIKSVLNQTYRHFELLVVDDASVDGSKKLIEKYVKKDTRVKHIRMERNIGLPAYTTGLAYLQSKGQFLAFAYDDCILFPNHLALLINKLQTEPHLGMAYGQANILWFDGRKQVIGSHYDAANMAKMNNHIPNVSVMIRRHVVETVGWYDPHFLLTRFYDWDLWVRIKKHYAVGFIEKVIAEEHGTCLHDSMGHSYTLFPELTLKYSREIRNKQLVPKVLKQYDPYRLNFQQQFNPAEKARLKLLLLEHFVKTFNIEGIIKLESQSGPGSANWKKMITKNIDIKDNRLPLLMHGLTRYSDWQTSILINQKNQTIHEKQRYINEKQSYINEQQKFIDYKEKYIHELLVRIRELEIFIQEQRRYINSLQ
jgi:glycosyltransferase involved in cell wall biosynthesis